MTALSVKGINTKDYPNTLQYPHAMDESTKPPSAAAIGDKRKVVPPHKRQKVLPPHLRARKEGSSKKNSNDINSHASEVRTALNDVAKLVETSPEPWQAELAPPPVASSWHTNYKPESSKLLLAASGASDHKASKKYDPTSESAATSLPGDSSDHPPADHDGGERGRSRIRGTPRRLRKGHQTVAQDSTTTVQSQAASKLPEDKSQDAFDQNEAAPSLAAKTEESDRVVFVPTKSGSAPFKGKANGSVWIANKQIPKANPKDDRSPWSSRASERSIPSGWTSLCANGNGGLASWEGEWAPAPLDWDSRPAFRDKQSAEQIEAWIQVSESAFANVLREVSIEEIQQDDGSSQCLSTVSNGTKEIDASSFGEIAPRYWIPHLIERRSPNAFWNYHKTSNAPTPCDEGDLHDAGPWWARFVQDRDILYSLPAPSIKGIDLDESIDERIARLNDRGSAQHAENRIRRERAKKESAVNSRRRGEERKQRILATMSTPPDETDLLSRRIMPRTNMVVRSARVADVDGILNIYNYHITHSCSAPELEARSHKEMYSLFREVQTHSLPFLVAFEPGLVVKPRKKKAGREDEGKKEAEGKKKNHEETVTLPDTILGFVYVQNLTRAVTQYEESVQARLFIHPTHTRKAVASCLMDKLLGLLDPSFLERGGFKVNGDELKGDGRGGYDKDNLNVLNIVNNNNSTRNDVNNTNDDAARDQEIFGPNTQRSPLTPIRNIILRVPYSDAERTEPWRRDWITVSMGFVQVGDLHKVGRKFGQDVSVAVFQRAISAAAT